MNQSTDSTSLASHHSLILEIGTEEIPARFLPSAVQCLRDNAATILNEHCIGFSNIETYATPRRLCLIVSGLPEIQASRVKEVFGPAKKVSFDAEGRPTKAAMKFADAQSVNVENLIVKKKNKGEYVVAVIEEKGLAVKDLLPELLRRIIFLTRFPKTMRWGNGSMRFARPIHWVLAMFGKETIHIEIEGIKSSNMTKGHPFLSPSSLPIRETATYKNLLKNHYVILDQKERKKIILEGIRKLSASVGGIPIEDDELIETVNFLVEYPVPVLCSFQKQYLELPKELLITVMKDHQKFFAVEDGKGRLMNYFIVVSNTKEENAETVRNGAERVIRARFEDAKFYIEEDRKKTLSARISELKKVTFQEKLRSLYEKSERIVSLAEFLSERLLPAGKDKLQRAAWLSKTDLLTGIVKEFPELQGTMGKYYALQGGEDHDIARALEEQYLPSHSGGELPRTEIGALLSIADKVDNIVSFFSIGLIPTGSEDPFALRRQSLGVIAILLDRGYNLPIKDLIFKALQNLSGLFSLPEKIEESILQFFEQRFDSLLSDKGYSHDLVQSVLAMSLDIHPKDVERRLETLKGFKEDREYNNFLLAIKRVNNIIPEDTIPEVKTHLLIEEAEKLIKERLDYVKSGLPGLVSEGRYQDAIHLLTSLTDPINYFFDHILVMDKRDDIRLNRLALLKEIWTMTYQIADFSKLKEI